MTVTQPIADRHLLRELTTLELILPAHNEEAAIAQTVQDWLAAFDHAPFEFRILVAEDGSKDETRAVVERLASRFPSRVRLTPTSARKGYSKAVLDAARVVNATLTAFCDGDGQFDPRELDRLAREVQPGVLVAGCRSPRVDSRFRVAASTAFGIVYRLLIGLKMEDPSSPFVVIRTDDLRTFLPERTHLAQGFWWEFFARAAAAGLTITEVPVTHRVRADGGRTQVYRAHKLPQIVATHVRGLVRLRREVRALDGTPTEGGRNEPPRGGSGEFQPWNGVCTTEAEPFPENGLVRVADTGAASTRSDKEAASSPRLLRSAVDPDGWLDGWDSADSTRRENGRLKILIIATESPPVRGGIAQSVRFISDGLRRRGHHVDVLAYPRVRRAVMGEVRVSSMAVHLIRNARRIANYDIINVHGVTPTVSDAALLAVRATRRRPALVYTHHVNVDFGPIGPVNALYNRLHRRLSASADKCVATTNAGLAALGDCGSVIAFGVDGQFLDDVRAKSGPYTVIYVGQFRPWKGVPILLDAVSRIGGARLIIAGHGNAAERYEQLAAELRIDAEFHVDVRTDELNACMTKRVSSSPLYVSSRGLSVGLLREWRGAAYRWRRTSPVFVKQWAGSALRSRRGAPRNSQRYWPNSVTILSFAPAWPEERGSAPCPSHGIARSRSTTASFAT